MEVVVVMIVVLAARYLSGSHWELRSPSFTLFRDAPPVRPLDGAATDGGRSG